MGETVDLRGLAVYVCTTKGIIRDGQEEQQQTG